LFVRFTAIDEKQWIAWEAAPAKLAYQTILNLVGRYALSYLTVA